MARRGAFGVKGVVGDARGAAHSQSSRDSPVLFRLFIPDAPTLERTPAASCPARVTRSSKESMYRTPFLRPITRARAPSNPRRHATTTSAPQNTRPRVQNKKVDSIRSHYQSWRLLVGNDRYLESTDPNLVEPRLGSWPEERHQQTPCSTDCSHSLSILRTTVLMEETFELVAHSRGGH